MMGTLTYTFVLYHNEPDQEKYLLIWCFFVFFLPSNSQKIEDNKDKIWQKEPVIQNKQVTQSGTDPSHQRKIGTIDQFIQCMDRILKE